MNRNESLALLQGEGFDRHSCPWTCGTQLLALDGSMPVVKETISNPQLERDLEVEIISRVLW